jgi:hypothetical protein
VTAPALALPAPVEVPRPARAITIKQPWCWCCAVGAKPVENRGTTTNHRGPIFLHSSKEDSARGWADTRVTGALVQHQPLPPKWPTQQQLAEHHAAQSGRTLAAWARGAIVGAAVLVDAHQAENGCCPPWGDDRYLRPDGTLAPRIVHLVFEQAVALEHPLPFRGALPIGWPLPDLVADAALADIRRAHPAWPQYPQ